jgi:hypothetical protein
MANPIPNYVTVTGLLADPNVASMAQSLAGPSTAAPMSMFNRFGVAGPAQSAIQQAMGDFGRSAGARLKTDYELARAPISAGLGWQAQGLNAQNNMANAGLANDQQSFMWNLMQNQYGRQNQYAQQGQQQLGALLNPFLSMLMTG